MRQFELERCPFALPYPTWQKALLRVGNHIVSVSSQFGKAIATQLTATALRQKETIFSDKLSSPK
jgi:hypothetical protein